MTSSPSVEQLLRSARDRVDAADAELLLLHALQRQGRAWLFAHARDPVPPDVADRYSSLLARRVGGEPLAYLIGHRGFWTLDLAVTPATLIPRPETELLVEQALLRLPANSAARVADLGTGSGAIALSIARERPRAQLFAIDVSEEALAVARANARAHDIGNVEFRHGDWWSSLDGERFDVVASNPPYIAEHDPHLRQGDLRFEPQEALASGRDGLDAIRIIAAAAPAYLSPGGWLLLEHGWEQGAAVRAILCAAGFIDVATVQDLEARDRVSLGRLAW